jgi:ribonucleoside-diphosphate reductase alpha chain
VPQDLVVLQGGMGMTGFSGMGAAGDMSTTLLMPETAKIAVGGGIASTALSSGTVSMDQRSKAKMQGYEGDPCGECGNYTLVRNGTCMKCNTCGGTSGCS